MKHGWISRRPAADDEDEWEYRVHLDRFSEDAELPGPTRQLRHCSSPAKKPPASASVLATALIAAARAATDLSTPVLTPPSGVDSSQHIEPPSGVDSSQPIILPVAVDSSQHIERLDCTGSTSCPYYLKKLEEDNVRTLSVAAPSPAYLAVNSEPQPPPVEPEAELTPDERETFDEIDRFRATHVKEPRSWSLASAGDRAMTRKIARIVRGTSRDFWLHVHRYARGKYDSIGVLEPMALTFVRSPRIRLTQHASTPAAKPPACAMCSGSGIREADLLTGCVVYCADCDVGRERTRRANL